MTTHIHDAINWCEDCEIQYVAHQPDRCPLCPLREASNAAQIAVYRAEPFNLLTADEAWRMEHLLNAAVADVWTLEDFKVVRTVQDGEEATLFAALLKRDGYDRDRHKTAVEARKAARDAHHEKAQEIASETAAVKAARSGQA